MAILRNSCLSLITLMYIGCGGGSDSSTPATNIETLKTYKLNVVDDAVADALVEAIGCSNPKKLGSGEYSLECSSSPKYISAKGGFVDLNNDGIHNENEVSMGLPLLVNLDENLFDINLSNISVTPLTTLVANITDKQELSDLAKKLGIGETDFLRDISTAHSELFQRLNTLLIIAESSGITDQLLLMKELRKEIIASDKSEISEILTDALEELKTNTNLQSAYGSVFISGFIDESQSFMDKKDVLDALSEEYSDSDDTKVFITGFIYDALIAYAEITILDGNDKVGEVKSSEKGKWKIAIDKTILDEDKVLLFTGTAVDVNGDKILLKSAISTQELREMAKQRISVADSIDLVISNVTTAQVAILEKNDKDFLEKSKDLEESKNEIEVFQQDLLLKASSAIKTIIDGNVTIEENENTYSFIFDNLVFKDESQESIELNLDGKISEEELILAGNEIKKDAILSQQLLSIESEKELTPILEKSLYFVEYSGVPLVKKYKKMLITNNKLTETEYRLEGTQWQELSSVEYDGKIENNVFYFDTLKSAPYAITLKEQKEVFSEELNKEYMFNILGKQLYLPYGNEDITKVGINIYAESFDIVSVFKDLEDSQIVDVLGADYYTKTVEEQNLALSLYLMSKISEKPEPFNRTETNLTSAINILDTMNVETDDVNAKLSEVETILNSASIDDKDAQVGKSLFALAEITNSSSVGSLVELSINGSSIATADNLASLIEDKPNLEVELLSSITDLSGTSMAVIHDTVLKLQDINKTLASNFADETYSFSYKDVNISSNQSKILRSAILASASELEYLTAFDYLSMEDVKIQTTTINGISVEYRSIDADPLTILKRSDVGVLNSSFGGTRLANAKELLLESLDVLDTVVATKEAIEDQQNILDAQAETSSLRASLNGTALYRTEEENDGVTIIKEFDLLALYSASTALDLTHTLGHDFSYKSNNNYYDYLTDTEYTAGSYNLAFSQFYNEPMSNEWLSIKDGSVLSYVDGAMERPMLDLETKSIVTGTNSHIPSILKKVTIQESGEFDIVHTGDNVLKYLFNSVNFYTEYLGSSVVKYIIEDDAQKIPDSTIEYGVDVLYGNVELQDADPIKGEVTVKIKDGFTGEQCYGLDIYDNFGHYDIVHNCLYEAEVVHTPYNDAVALDASQFPFNARYSLYDPITEFKESNGDTISVSEYDLNTDTWRLSFIMNYHFEDNEFVLDSDQDGDEDYRLKYLGSISDYNEMNSAMGAEIFAEGAESYHFMVKHINGVEDEFYQFNETAKNQYVSYITTAS